MLTKFIKVVFIGVMASNLKKKTVSVDNVIKSKRCCCGKVINPDENETNIKTHFGVCPDA